MSEQEDGTLAHHLTHLAANADDVVSFLNRSHEEGEIHPEALAKSEHLATSLKEVVHALSHHEHLAMDSDDVWRALTRDHKARTDDAVN